jgi:hypothetical protein
VELAEPTKTSKEVKSEQQSPVCTVGFCPICMAVTTAQPLKPELIEHLLSAGREFLLAAKAILDARTEHVTGDPAAKGGKVRHLEKIDIG